jgi:RNA polymerase sigma-70 factor (ECF subfamily)
MEWPPSASLIERAKDGEPDALGAIFAAAVPRIRSFLAYQGFRDAARDEIVGAAMESVLHKVSTLRQTQSFEAWFWAVVRNSMRGYLRQQQKLARITELPPTSPLQPDEHVLMLEEHQTIRTALEGLSPADRELLWLREVEGLTYQEIGGRLGAKTGAVRVRCYRARRRLREAYEAAQVGRETGDRGENGHYEDGNTADRQKGAD